MSSGRSSTGHATMFKARNGVPPIAYTSDIAFVAAMRPQSYGSSTIGVKKSSVAMMARSSSSAQTAASSPVSTPTSTSDGTPGSCNEPITSSSWSGPSLQPHPAP